MTTWQRKVVAVVVNLSLVDKTLLKVVFIIAAMVEMLVVFDDLNVVPVGLLLSMVVVTWQGLKEGGQKVGSLLSLESLIGVVLEVVINGSGGDVTLVTVIVMLVVVGSRPGRHVVAKKNVDDGRL